jgi:N-acetylmuramoyl-L-alanine amidase
MRTFRRGDRGDAVRDVQSRLVALSFSVHPTELQRAEFGPSTEAAVRTFQQERGLLVDGLVGPDTWEELVEAGYALGDRVLYLRRPSVRGDDVRTLQARLNLLGFDPGREDGIFGEHTSTAVRQFQLNVGLAPDGLVGATTVQALDRLIRSPGRGPGRTAVREEETMRVPSGSLAGRAIALDPGHGPGDTGATGPGGLDEADAAFAIVERLARELEERGARPFVLRSRGDDPPLSERASRANAVDAEALVSIHLNSHDDPGAEGSSSYYFGRFESGSVAGQALAELVQEELTAATGLPDGRTHPKSFPMLRETRMPAVQIEPCFITNPREEELLRQDDFVAEVARAVTRALERFLAGRDARAPADG